MKSDWKPITDEAEFGLYMCKDEKGNEFPAVHSTNLKGEKVWVMSSLERVVAAFYKSLNDK